MLLDGRISPTSARDLPPQCKFCFEACSSVSNCCGAIFSSTIYNYYKSEGRDHVAHPVSPRRPWDRGWVKFILSFQNFGKKIACAVRHNRVATTITITVTRRNIEFVKNLHACKTLCKSND